MGLARARQLSMTKSLASGDPQLAYGRALVAERSLDSVSSALDDVVKYSGGDSKVKQLADTANRTLESVAVSLVKLKTLLKSGKHPEA